MLTDEDIQKITAVVATKKDLEQFVTKAEFSQFHEEMAEFRNEMRDFKDRAFTMLDAIVKSIEDLKMEYVAVKMQLDRHERWIKELAEKIGIKLSTD